MASRYVMSVKDRITGETAEFAPGQRAEIDLVTDSVDNAVRLGIGLGRTTAQSAAAMRQGMEDAIYALKAKVQV